jgi:hypothetical protein
MPDPVPESEQMWQPGSHATEHLPEAATQQTWDTVRLETLHISLPQVVAEAIRALPSPADWLTRVITEAACRELLESSAIRLALQPASPLLPSTEPSTELSTNVLSSGSHASHWGEGISTAEPDPIPIGSLVRNSLRWLGTVQTYNPDTGRYLVAFNNGILREFPRHLLTFVALENLP